MNYAAKRNIVKENIMDEKKNYYGPNTKCMQTRHFTETFEGKEVRKTIPLPVPGEGRGIRIKEDDYRGIEDGKQDTRR